MTVDPTIEQFPVSVIVERQAVDDNPWLSSRSRVLGVVAAEADHGMKQGEVIREDGATTHRLWSGFRLKLHRDELESYYQNLRGEQPGVFVICNGDADSELEPFLTTLSYDEASSYMEVDAQVFNLPIPPEIYLWMERYVVDNYAPEKRVKRKRKTWFKEGEKENGSRRQTGRVREIK